MKIYYVKITPKGEGFILPAYHEYFNIQSFADQIIELTRRADVDEHPEENQGVQDWVQAFQGEIITREHAVSHLASLNHRNPDGTAIIYELP